MFAYVTVIRYFVIHICSMGMEMGRNGNAERHSRTPLACIERSLSLLACEKYDQTNVNGLCSSSQIRQLYNRGYGFTFAQVVFKCQRPKHKRKTDRLKGTSTGSRYLA